MLSKAQTQMPSNQWVSRGPSGFLLSPLELEEGGREESRVHPPYGPCAYVVCSLPCPLSSGSVTAARCIWSASVTSRRPLQMSQASLFSCSDVNCETSCNNQASAHLSLPQVCSEIASLWCCEVTQRILTAAGDPNRGQLPASLRGLRHGQSVPWHTRPS